MTQQVGPAALEITRLNGGQHRWRRAASSRTAVPQVMFAAAMMFVCTMHEEAPASDIG
ncbi:hypothetical protein SIM91_43710 [Rhodococcus opacus]|uniref:hypothetical protein n=1 Tax=Rhodococcus opacus TaxID=37919 RepID=UPI0012DAEB26|nr:hypothetical protein [Rhodococcus opacus]MDX5970066.1 hypothetical protein [Rhodococcus opacus]